MQVFFISNQVRLIQKKTKQSFFFNFNDKERFQRSLKSKNNVNFYRVAMKYISEVKWNVKLLIRKIVLMLCFAVYVIFLSFDIWSLAFLPYFYLLSHFENLFDVVLSIPIFRDMQIQCCIV